MTLQLKVKGIIDLRNKNVFNVHSTHVTKTFLIELIMLIYYIKAILKELNYILSQ